MSMWWSRFTRARAAEPTVRGSGAGTTTVVRTGLLGLCAVLTLLSPSRWDDLPWLALVVSTALLSRLVESQPTGALAAPAIDSVVCVVAVLLSGTDSSPLLPSLLGPSFAAGLAVGAPGAALTTALPALTLVAAGLGGHQSADYIAAAATWTALAAASGAGAAKLRAVAAARASADNDPSYAAAYRLLAQLRPVARQLSVGLDTVTIADGLCWCGPGAAGCRGWRRSVTLGRPGT
jgi:hypothetical protein